MDKKELTIKLSEVVKGIPEASISFDGIGNTMSRESLYYFSIDGESLSDLINYLFSLDSIVQVFDNMMFNTGNGAHRVTIESLARWLVGRAKLVGIEQVINELDYYLQAKNTPCWQVLAISGVSLDSELIISEKMKLVPFQELPESYAKEALYPPFMKPEFVMRLGFAPNQMNGYRPPEAAAVLSSELSPKSYSDPDRAFYGQDFQSLYEFCEFLTLVKSTTPVPVGSWCDLEESVPCKPLLGGSWGSPAVDVLSRNVSKITQGEWDTHKELYFKFTKLPQDVRDLLRVPIERVNQARRRNNLADKAIDLGVACEALLLNDKSHKEQISFTLRLRAALFLGSSFEERQELLNFFSSFYSCRSQAAHTGKLDTKIKVSFRGKVEANKLLEEGDEYCIRAIIKIIELGKFPDWNELMLKKEIA
ncbi:hypothetical protein VIOR3934_02717 [Vibrio orientalis CIP 102891 = ATCC 33934]|uniref:Uncharacterized protein n=1 Tax=Vibrio orientalis CIP 102891 = ATCC 33934 TaxID=675816 RepID=C9QK77_VIBOR|nr:HEPN domain-containing protein [Vibrio orientalis]EEX92072.1 hypothetical protein VIA_002716 [Vibrio orientalis CIP 102891 = ATCC 33934]EGU47246.1 hypothetical protein VIOR3934_02717 [Vibrio orientalis CIP 102891 = ATCC 33934]